MGFLVPKKKNMALKDILLQARVSELQSEERRLRESLDTATSRAQVLLLIMILNLSCVNLYSNLFCKVFME